MKPERWQQVKALLAEAQELAPGARTVFVEERCAGDEELKAEVASLLSYSDTGDPTGMPPAREIFQAISGRAGQMIGPYRIERLLGEGGMGAVYLAYREVDGYPMRVALKVMRVAALSEYSLRRFRMERQILARLAHPNITRLLDGGLTADGLPYLVTEFIDGVPLCQYCNQHAPSLEQRLRIFLDICDALASAHRNLIVHGDIKPGNILVTEEGVAKLVDFGIARLVDPGGEDSGSTTTFAFTPAWASPEQLRGGSPSVLSDVYSAGRVFYELIAGHSAYGLNGLPPHEYLETLASAPRHPSAACGDHRLEGDLDNIALKALEFEPAHRYQSAEQFAADVRSYLESRPVSARKPTWTYRASKFVRRYRGSVTAALLAGVAVLGMLGATLWQARRASQQYALATRQAEAVRRLANTFVFELDDAVAELPGSTNVRARIMQNAVEYLDRLAQESAGDSGLQQELGLAYLKVGDILGRPGAANLGKTADALENYDKARKILEPLARFQNASAERRANLAEVYGRISAIKKVRGEFNAALELDQQALAIRLTLQEDAPGDPEQKRAVAQSLTSLGGTFSQLGRWKKTLETRQQALKLYEELVAANPDNASDRRGLVLARTRLGSIMSHEGLHAEALVQLRTAVVEQKALLDRNPANSSITMGYGSSLAALARGLDQAGFFVEAIAAHQSARSVFESLVAADPADVRARSLLATSRTAIGTLLVKTRRPAEALEHLQAALHMRGELARKDPQNSGALGEVAESHAALAEAYASLHRTAAAETAFGQAETILRALAREGRANAADHSLLARITKGKSSLPLK